MTECLDLILRQTAGTFIDVGVNRLQTFFDLRSTGDERPYVGIEPNGHCVAYVLDVFRLNGQSNATMVPCALSSAAGLLHLFVHEGDTFDARGTTLETLRPERALDQTVVAAMTLDTVLRDLLIEKVAFLKIDVEGGELSVLRGSSVTLRDLRPLILCEVLHRDGKADPIDHADRRQQLLSLLHDHRYLVLQILKPPGTERIDTLRLVDDFADKVWTESNAWECDYIFCPFELFETRVAGRFAIASQ